MSKYLSRGFACQDASPADPCSGYAHEEWVTNADDPIGSGTLVCHHHGDIRRTRRGTPDAPRPACTECHATPRE